MTGLRILGQAVIQVGSAVIPHFNLTEIAFPVLMPDIRMDR